MDYRMGILDTVIGTLVGVVGTAGVTVLLRKKDAKLSSQAKALDLFAELKSEQENLIKYLERRKVQGNDREKLRRILKYLESTFNCKQNLTKFYDENLIERELDKVYAMNYEVVLHLSLKEKQQLFVKNKYLK